MAVGVAEHVAGKRSTNSALYAPKTSGQRPELKRPRGAGACQDPANRGASDPQERQSGNAAPDCSFGLGAATSLSDRRAAGRGPTEQLPGADARALHSATRRTGPTVPLPGNAVALDVVPRAPAPERLRASDQVATPAPAHGWIRFRSDSPRVRAGPDDDFCVRGIQQCGARLYLLALLSRFANYPELKLGGWRLTCSARFMATPYSG
jgi:hypothetical protein